MKHRHFVSLFACTCFALAGCAVESEDGCADGGPFGIDPSSSERPEACPDDALRLAIDTPLAHEGRMAMVWFELDPTDPDPTPLIGLDVPLSSGQRSVRVPMSSISIPMDQALFFCERASDDEATCECLDEGRFATATVVFATDDDRNGRTDVEEATKRVFGLARASIG